MATGGTTTYSDNDVLLYFPVYAVFAQNRQAEMTARLNAFPDKQTKVNCLNFCKYIATLPPTAKDEYVKRFTRLNEARIATTSESAQKTLVHLQSLKAEEATREKRLAELAREKTVIRAALHQDAQTAAKELKSGNVRQRTPA